MRTVCLILGFVTLMVIGVAGKEVLMLYTSTPIEIMTELEKAFETAHPDIDLQVFRSGTGTIAAKIAAERAAGKILADLIWVAEYTYLEELKSQGLLLRYESPEAANIPDLLIDPDRYYYGARIFALVIAYNTTLVQNPPRTWTDLLNPRWRGELITANPQYSGSNAIAAAVLGMEYGLDFFRGLAANNTAVVQGNSQVVTEVAAGAYSVGLTLDNMVRSLQLQGSPIALVYPDDGAVFLPSPIGIFAGTQREEAAKKFVDYVLSAEGQRALVRIGAYIPARLDVEGPAGAPSLAELVARAMPASVEAIVTNIRFYTDQFVKILLGM